MPLRIIEGESPEPVPWGSLPLDIYLLSEWETPHPSQPTESPSARRRRLIRQFLALGLEGRRPYQARTETPPTPTKAQIAEILLPVRPEALRPYAAYTTCLEEGLWLRLCYKKEEAHESIWSHNEDVAYVGPDGVVLDDEEIFGGLDLAAALEIFPERVTNGGSSGHIKLREETLREILGDLEDDTGSGEEDYSDDIKEKVAEFRASRAKNPLLKYGLYHAACVVTHAFVEDEVALDGGGLLHVFWDDCGNVVRQWRVEDDGAEDNFDGAWAEGAWKENFINGIGELGPAYHEGGMRGPPYNV
ncbi:hypothetical protein E8E15_003093 [Penicillium rubens]|uniref:Pc16g03330 protein n=2 Tax=Penicillium chrysogenum species complex TaxID=254878 RepID=B6H7N8_PENRW|nr:hypothetical protein E8E15_003093 [Penicillium rubens]KAJ5036995.1 hypothetical protein NUH16_004876 [Penicillium rubens]KZN83614.1 hypothetical protein EN45_107190 [Penicillium chrysogenum]CAP93003.1 Pc16g03330 [Penicillium rubens Wisconsin 54-1255]